MNDLIQSIAVYALPVLFAITLHEAAHAYAAKYFGDDTAFLQGRISLNPIKHIDPLGTIIIPIALYIATQGAFLFGYAKPVPIDFRNLKNPKRDMLWVAFAGPAANFFMALLWTILSIGLKFAQITEPFLMQMAQAGIFVNLLLFAFNLLPIPPLDGGRVLISLLPHNIAVRVAQIEPYGFFIVMAMVAMNLVGFWMLPVVSIANGALQILVSPLNFF
ncbi:MAG: site-2 protease family protein [Pseudomonadota bacterium]